MINIIVLRACLHTTHYMFATPCYRHSPLYSERVLELNASDERGIDVIRHKVKSFAQLAVSNVASRETTTAPPPYKLIVLDEADSMTAPAQVCRIHFIIATSCFMLVTIEALLQ